VGEFSKVVFQRSKLPERCIIYASAYLPPRKDMVKRFFDSWTRVRGMWVRYSFAEAQGKDFLVLFNVYGAAMMLEVLYLLRDGGVRQVFFVGSIGAKRLEIGTLVAPYEVVDLAGVARLDDRGEEIVKPPKKKSKKLVKKLTARRYPYVSAKLASVPAVLHGIRRVHEHLQKDENIEGHEMELSTFYHFSRKIGFRAWALVYVSDNPKHSIVSCKRSVVIARRKARSRITRVALDVLG
jgi:purine-nucleoside phosphorylase